MINDLNHRQQKIIKTNSMMSEILAKIKAETKSSTCIFIDNLIHEQYGEMMEKSPLTPKPKPRTISKVKGERFKVI